MRVPWPLLRLFQVALGLLFLTSALAKIGDTGSLATQVHYFRLVPAWSENLFGMTLPWIELLCGLALVLGVRARAGAWVALASLVVFTVAVGIAMARGLNFECGCFGTLAGTRVGWAKLGENAAMIVLAVLASLRAR